jgi:hypothetical protein
VFAPGTTIERLRPRIPEVETIADAGLDADAVAAHCGGYEVLMLFPVELTHNL